MRRGASLVQLLWWGLPPTLSRIARLKTILSDASPQIVADPSRKLAAVALIFVPDPDSILVIKRAERAGDRWSGQMAFPGGRWDPADDDLVTTARRETWEEVGVDLASAEFLGRLDDSAPRSASLPPVTVAPFVFALPRRRPLVPNGEVAAAYWVSLDQLVAPDVYRPYQYRASGLTMTFPGYHLDAGVIWGMTERILTPLLSQIGLSPSGSPDD